VKKIAAVLIAFLLLGCSKDDSSKKEVKENIHTYKVTAQKVQSYIEATGTVQPDLEGGAKIVSPIQGSVEKILVKVGDRVAKGTPLAALKSSDVSDTYAGHLSATAQLRQAEQLYKLNKELFELGAVTKNDLLNSEANYEQAKALSEGINKKLDIYGVSGEGFRDSLTIKAPIVGTVADIQAHIGDRFDTSTPLMMIANSNKIVVVANIFDTEIQKIHKGKEVTFYADVFPDSVFKGTVAYISDVEDMDSKTVKTYIRNIRGTGLLKQNMFLKIKILEGERLLPVVPKTAVIFKEGKFYVNKKKGDLLELQAVRPIGSTSEKMIAVEGLNDGDEIVFSAIDLEKP